MSGTKELKEYVYSIISYHENKDFEALSDHILKKEIKAGSWFAQERFIVVCGAIKKEIGNITPLEYISTLNRKSSYLTLWKTTYSKSKDEVLWQIIFDTTSNKIKLMHINWEQI
jgi:hypothetical protein